uniref:Uncharacterized protein n=1 Tax=Meloidogyne incognita TaxID=6306 RepID=A0A914LIG9_MELIC
MNNTNSSAIDEVVAHGKCPARHHMSANDFQQKMHFAAFFSLPFLFFDGLTSWRIYFME